MKTPIGVFDSGFGGLEILREIKKKLPEYDYIYLGDAARSPYGNRKQEEIYQFTEQAVDFLFNKNCGLIILACNTVSSEALRKIQQQFLTQNYPNKRVLGVLIPGSEIAVEVTKNNKIGVMATKGTIESQSFVRELKKINPKTEVFQQACPLLVPLIENGGKNIEKVLQNYLEPLLEKNIDTLILGCTHYGLVLDKIKKIVGDEINIISEGEIVADKLDDYFKRHAKLEKSLSKGGSVEFLTTGSTKSFEKIGSKFWGKFIKVNTVDIIS